ncbi:MAG TPA: response regulator [Anaeromyxobacteraceae bacterium]|nr:response regulator [Anaeromyxobacteraceae bacterium]
MGDGARVLLVEDDDDFRDLLAEALGAEGLEVVAARSAEAALEALAGRGVDAVVTDLGVPRAGGLAVARAAKARGAIPVVLVTGHPEREELARARPREIDAVLGKPFEPEALAEAIRRLLGSGRAPDRGSS